LLHDAKLQWLQHPSKTNADYLGKARREASGHFKDK
jgi:hypothetical protein